MILGETLSVCMFKQITDLFFKNMVLVMIAFASDNTNNNTFIMQVCMVASVQVQGVTFAEYRNTKITPIKYHREVLTIRKIILFYFW